MDNDSETEDLPSYSFVSSECNEEKKTPSTLSSASVLANRLKNEEYFKKVESIRNSVQYINTSGDSHSDVLFEDDEDTKEFIKKAEELKVQSTTLYYIPDLQFLKPELIGRLFSHETLQLEKFMGSSMKKLHTKMYDKKIFEDMVRTTGIQVTEYSKNTRSKLNPYLFFLMSVHPEFEMVQCIYSYLVMQSDYSPTVSDVINVLQNWGASLQDMFPTPPNSFNGLHPALVDCEPDTEIAIQNHNMHLLLKYLAFVLKTKTRTTYFELLGPMLKFSVNVDTYLSNIKISVCEVVRLLATIENHQYPLESLHQKDLSLRNQFFLCSKSLACTNLQLSLSYAALQQFLGLSDIIYTEDVDLKSVLDLVVRNKASIIGETFNETSYILKIIDLLVRRISAASEEDYMQKYVAKWLRLLSDLSLEIQESHRLSDPVLLKDQIAQMSYDLRINRSDLHSIDVDSVDM